jgi:hypothetical protein
VNDRPTISDSGAGLRPRLGRHPASSEHKTGYSDGPHSGFGSHRRGSQHPRVHVPGWDNAEPEMPAESFDVKGEPYSWIPYLSRQLKRKNGMSNSGENKGIVLHGVRTRVGWCADLSPTHS